jgi:hypothetical protein
MPPNDPEGYGPKRGRFSVPETVGLPDYDPTDPYGIASEGGAEYDNLTSLMRGMTGNITNADRRRMLENAQGRGQQIAGGLDQYADLLTPTAGDASMLQGWPLTADDESLGTGIPLDIPTEPTGPSVITPGPKPPPPGPYIQPGDIPPTKAEASQFPRAPGAGMPFPRTPGLASGNVRYPDPVTVPGADIALTDKPGWWERAFGAPEPEFQTSDPDSSYGWGDRAEQFILRALQRKARIASGKGEIPLPIPKPTRNLDADRGVE